MELIRSDFVFSYWLFAWFLIYYWWSVTKTKTTTILHLYNPKFALILGVFENILMMFLLLYTQSSIYKITKFIFINVFLKAIPLYLLWNTEIQWWGDIYFTVFIFLVYLGWLYINNLSLGMSYKNLMDAYLHDKDIGDKKTWLSYMYDIYFTRKK